MLSRINRMKKIFAKLKLRTETRTYTLKNLGMSTLVLVTKLDCFLLILNHNRLTEIEVAKSKKKNMTLQDLRSQILPCFEDIQS